MTHAGTSAVRLLIVEDDVYIASGLDKLLKNEGHVIDIVDTLDSARAALLVADYELILLDRGLPDGDGIRLFRTEEYQKSKQPVLILTAMEDVPERVKGLDAGAADYLVKPFEPDELLARIRSALRLSGHQETNLVKISNLIYDPLSKQASVGDVPLVFPRRELLILDALIMNAGRVVLRRNLENYVYKLGEEISSNSLDVNISRLRQNLKKGEVNAEIHAVRGLGYLIKAGNK